MSTAVQTAVLNSITAGATTIPLPAFGASVTVGNKIIAVFSFDRTNSGVITGVADGLGNTYTQMTNSPINDATSVQAMGIWTATVTTGGTATVVATVSASEAFRSGCAVEYSGLGVLDVVAAATNHGTATTGANGMSNGSLTPSAAGATIIATGEFHNGATMTAGTGWTQDATSGASGGSASIERIDQDVPASVTGQWTTGVAGNFNALVFAWQAPTSVVTVKPFNPIPFMN